MRRAMLALCALTACGGGPGDGDGDDGATIDGPALDGAALDGREPDARPGDASPDAMATNATILFQCTPFDGGVCAMDADGGDRRTLHATGFAPHGAADGAVLFHTAAYRVTRRAATGATVDLGDGAFARPHPAGGILFQCAGLAGGLCTMRDDGTQRTQLRATGRVPDVDGTGRVLFHTDAYRVIRRAPGGAEQDLGDGAFATWTDDGRILFQCSGLGGGLCRMAADGSGRETLAPAGRVPDADASGRVVFHTDAYQVVVRATGGATTALSGGANATWWR